MPTAEQEAPGAIATETPPQTAETTESPDTSTESQEPPEPDRQEAPPTDAAQQSPESLEAIQAREIATLRAKLAKVTDHERRVMDAECEVADCEAVVNDRAAELKAAKKDFDDAVAALRSIIKQRDGQQELPFGEPATADEPAEPEASEQTDQPAEQPPAPDVDEWAATPLTQIGVTPSQCEKLAGLEPAVETVGQLERLIADGGFVPGRIKGIGDTAINKISDKLLEFRKSHPREVPPVPDAPGGWDPTSFTAGKIARAQGYAIEKNPHDLEVWPDLASSWDAGWAAEDEQRQPTRGPADEAIELCDRVAELIDALPPEGAEFGAGVRETMDGIRRWVLDNGHATDAQLETLRNQITGLEAWQHE